MPGVFQRDRRSLLKWRTGQRSARLSDAQRSALAELDPLWEEPFFTPWEMRLEEAQRITASLGRLPKSTDTDPAALSAYKWLRKQLRHPSDHPRRAALDRALPGWGSTRDGVWEQKLDLVVEYFAANGRLPSLSEKTCGMWLNKQKQRVSDSRRSELDRRLPGWDTTAEDRWNDALDFVASYFADYGHFPSSVSKDPEVRFHGEWFIDQKRDRAGTTARTEAMDRRLPGWRHGNTLADMLWEARLNEYLNFVTVAGRRPSVGAASDPAERRLVVWLNNQRACKNPRRLTTLDDRIPGWRGARSKQR